MPILLYHTGNGPVFSFDAIANAKGGHNYGV
jgi:hypothetical protein